MIDENYKRGRWTKYKKGQLVTFGCHVYRISEANRWGTFQLSCSACLRANGPMSPCHRIRHYRDKGGNAENASRMLLKITAMCSKFPPLCFPKRIDNHE